MANDNETVAEVCERVNSRIDELWEWNIGCMENGEVDDFAKEFLAAHEREIAAKDAEIARLNEQLVVHECWSDKECEDADTARTCAELESKELQDLVKELADALDSYPCHNCKHGSERCEWCGKAQELDALVARAREVAK